ncbi:hypothetical protein ACFFX0_05005 [Citricoccus parietis]|uniref:Uncharacterized protein n=1 Tax=Citricoccus parietis TaxID=592307 RepID=A0ABV5FVA5_9MICC
MAHRPLPSMTMATWRGMNRGSICGGRAPDGCGYGSARAGRRAEGREGMGSVLGFRGSGP